MEAAKPSSTSAVVRPAAASTSSAGEATGPNVARNSVREPAAPAPIVAAQNALVLSRWTITSRDDHPSHRLGWDHSASVKAASAAASRSRWRMVGSAIAAGSPSRLMIGSGP